MEFIAYCIANITILCYYIGMNIDMDSPIEFLCASFRYFGKGEQHVTRFCNCDVLLLVFDGVLRFSEDGKEYEIAAGNYHIQKAGAFQQGLIPSDEPKYLYVHFNCKRAPKGLSPFGKFSCGAFMPLMQQLHDLERREGTYTEKCAVFFDILTRLYRKELSYGTAEKIATYLRTEFNKNVSLEILAAEFGYSKNQIINIFKKHYRTTPFRFLTDVRLKEAEKLLAETNKPTETVAYDCGFNDYSSFYKAFLNKTALSPTDWRNNAQRISK